MRADLEQAAGVIGAQAGRIAALVEAMRALIESHPDPLKFRQKFMAQVAASPIASLDEDADECIRGHREVVNYLTDAIPLRRRSPAPTSARRERRARPRSAHPRATA
jgi:hypothetical protein